MDRLVDLADVQRLIEIAERHGLEAVRVTEDDVEIEVVIAPAEAGEPAETGAVAAREGLDEPVTDDLYRLKSPVTGVFYRSPSPTEPPFVQIGEVVEEHEVVGLIEAMKIFNEITAGVAGRLVRVVAANEQLVVTGEALMEFELLERGPS